MDGSIGDKNGIYIAYPTSSKLKSIYRAKNYKTKVNEKHTKVGIASNSFSSRKGVYISNFDNKVIFKPIAIIPNNQLEIAEKKVLKVMGRRFHKVGHSREWFQTANRQKVIDIVFNVLDMSGLDYERIG